MEERKIQEIFNALKNETLSERERFVMRKELELLMKDHPLKVPFHIQAAEYMHAIDSAAFNYVGGHSMAMAVLAFVFVVGVGTSYAAGGALPGDVLYPIKIHINEQVQGALAVSDVAKVEWSAELTEKRLEEAEVLAAKGTLNDKNSAEITAQLDQSAQNFDQNAAALAQSTGGQDAASDAQSDLDASLAAHEHLLVTLGDKIPDIKQAITPILSSVRARAGGRLSKGNPAPTLMAAMMVATDSSAKKVSTEDKNTLARKKLRAQQTLKEVRDIATQAKATIGSSTYSYFHNEASSSEQTITTGDKNADEGNYDQALQSYQEALRVSAEAKAGLNAEIHIRQNVHLSNFDFISVTTGDDTTSNSEEGTGGIDH